MVDRGRDGSEMDVEEDEEEKVWSVRILVGLFGVGIGHWW